MPCARRRAGVRLAREPLKVKDAWVEKEVAKKLRQLVRRGTLLEFELVPSTH